MPIKGVGDIPNNLIKPNRITSIDGIGNALPRAGYLKQGKKGKEITVRGKKVRPPVKFGHFVITTMEKDSDENYVVDQDAMAVIGEKPRTIKGALLVGHTTSEVFPHSLSHWGASKIKCQGNRVVGTPVDSDGMAVVDDNGEIITKECPCELFEAPGGCRYNGVLNLLLPNHGASSGVYQFKTKGITLIDSIASALNWEMGQRQSNRELKDWQRSLMGLECDLTLVEKRSTEGFKYDTLIMTITGIGGTQIAQGSIGEIEEGALDITDEDIIDGNAEFYSVEDQVARQEQEIHQTATEPLASADVPSDVSEAATEPALTDEGPQPPADGVFRRDDLIWRGNHAGMPWNDKRVTDGYLATIFEQVDAPANKPDDKMYCEFAGEEIAARIDADKVERQANDGEAAEEEVQADASDSSQESMY